MIPWSKAALTAATASSTRYFFSPSRFGSATNFITATLPLSASFMFCHSFLVIFAASHISLSSYLSIRASTSIIDPSLGSFIFGDYSLSGGTYIAEVNVLKRVALFSFRYHLPAVNIAISCKILCHHAGCGLQRYVVNTAWSASTSAAAPHPAVSASILGSFACRRRFLASRKSIIFCRSAGNIAVVAGCAGLHGTRAKRQ